MVESQRLHSVLGDSRTVWVVGCLIVLIFALGNLPWQLDDYDQAKQAFTSFQMVEEGRWLYQTTPHNWIATKPPLVGWVSASVFGVTRSWELAWRLPSFAAAIAIAFLLFRSSRSAYGEVAAIIAVAAFGFNLLSPRLATLARTDMPLALVIFAVGLISWNKIRKAEPWRPNDQVIVFGLLTAGMLTKGPVVWAFLLPGIVGYELWRRREGVSAFCGFWPWILSLGVFFCWVAGGIYFVPGFYQQVVVREFLGRFGGEVHRAQPLLFYIPHLLHKFAPWSVLIVAFAIVRLRYSGWKVRGTRLSHEMAWLVYWSIGGLLVMSLLPSKRVDRIFPVVPPLCLLLAAQVSSTGRVFRQSERFFRWLTAAVLFGIVFTGGYVGWRISSGYREHRDALVKFGREVRKRADLHHWRYEAVASADEGLLLYLRKTRFISTETAVTEWNAGEMDALVVEHRDMAGLINQLQPAGKIVLETAKRSDRAAQDHVFVAKSD